MVGQLIKIFSYLLLATVCCARNSDDHLSTSSLIKRDGYPFEEHTIQTVDDYILTMHRIPYSPKLNNDASKRPVALFMHGMTFTSSTWVLNGPQSSLAYILSNAGYDVWLGNARGNEYSKKHASLSPKSSKFWDFDFHEIGAYDIPAMIDYIISVTGEEQLHYIGHSQGGTTLAIFGITNPTMQKHIRSAHLMAPSIFQSNAKSAVFKVGGPLLGRPNPILELFANTEIFPHSKAFQLLTSIACKDETISQGICGSFLELLFGKNSQYLNKTQLPDILGTVPAGASFKQLLHFLQLNRSGKFRQYDYGMLRNIMEYGGSQPPEYDLKKLVVPIYIYYSENDVVVTPADVMIFIDALNANTLKGVYNVPHPEWTHIDFVYGLDAENVLYKNLINDMASS